MMKEIQFKIIIYEPEKRYLEKESYISTIC